MFATCTVRTHVHMNVHRYVVHIHTCTCSCMCTLITNTCNPKTNLHTTYYVCTPTCSLLEPRESGDHRRMYGVQIRVFFLVPDFANYCWFCKLLVVLSCLLLFKMSVKVSYYYYKYSTCKMGTTCIPVSNGCCFFVQNFFYSVPPVYPGTTVEDSVKKSTVERS